MSEHEGALVAVTRCLDELGTSYAVIGGLANAVWGEPRATLDIDLTIRVEAHREPDLIEQLIRRFESLVAEPQRFVEETAVLPLRSEGGVRIDVIFARLPFEEAVVDRAVLIEIGGEAVRFCTAEDLILMKIISDRPRDAEDAHGVTLRRIHELDLGYLEPRILELASLLEQPLITERWTEWKREAGTA